MLNHGMAPAAKRAAARKAAGTTEAAGRRTAPKSTTAGARAAAGSRARTAAKQAAAPSSRVAGLQVEATGEIEATGDVQPTSAHVTTRTTGTPHRPSRRHLIVEAAVRVFARKGFSEASIQEIADDSLLVDNAVNKNIKKKKELFEAALSRAMDANDAVVAAARPDDAPASAEIFKGVVEASWAWTVENPDMARLLFLHMPGGATPGARSLARD